MGQFFTKIDNQQKLEEINLLQLENNNLKKKIQSLQKYTAILQSELNEIKQDYDSIIHKLGEIIN